MPALIAADEEFRKQDQVGIGGLAPGLAGAGKVVLDRSESRVELGERDDESVSHGEGS